MCREPVGRWEYWPSEILRKTRSDPRIGPSEGCKWVDIRHTRGALYAYGLVRGSFGARGGMAGYAVGSQAEGPLMTAVAGGISTWERNLGSFMSKPSTKWGARGYLYVGRRRAYAAMTGLKAVIRA